MRQVSLSRLHKTVSLILATFQFIRSPLMLKDDDFFGSYSVLIRFHVVFKCTILDTRAALVHQQQNSFLFQEKVTLM